MTDQLEEKTKIVVYYGRFQPPHVLHAKVYEHLLTKFNNVYIGMTDKLDKERSPLSFDDRKYIWKTLSNVTDSNVLKINKTYSSLEIRDILKLKESYSYVCAVSEKDSERLINGKYFLKYEDGMKLKTADEFGYYYIIPEYRHIVLNENMSGTHIRNIIRQNKIGSLIPYYNPNVINLLRSKIV